MCASTIAHSCVRVQTTKVARRRLRASGPQGVYFPRVVGDPIVGIYQQARVRGRLAKRYIVPPSNEPIMCHSCGEVLVRGTSVDRRKENTPTGSAFSYKHKSCKWVNEVSSSGDSAGIAEFATPTTESVPPARRAVFPHCVECGARILAGQLVMPIRGARDERLWRHRACASVGK